MEIIDHIQNKENYISQTYTMYSNKYPGGQAQCRPSWTII